LSVVIVWVHFAFEGTSSVGCGLELPRIAHSQNGALELANASHRASFSALSFNTGRLTREGLTPAWCLENRAEREAALDCLVCRIRKIVNSNRRVRVHRVNFSTLSANTGQFDPCLVLGELSRVECGARLPRIAFSQKTGPRIGEYASGPSNIGEVAFSTVTVYVCLMFVNASSVGCGGMAPCFAHSQNRALKPTSSRRRLEDSRFRYDHRREWYVFGDWIRRPSGMRPLTASHCVIANWDLQ